MVTWLTVWMLNSSSKISSDREKPASDVSERISAQGTDIRSWNNLMASPAVPLQIRMEQGSSFFHGLPWDQRPPAIPHYLTLNLLQGLLGLTSVSAATAATGSPDIADPVNGEEGLILDPSAKEERKILARHHCLDPGALIASATSDLNDPGMGEGAPQSGAIKHTGNGNVEGRKQRDR